jgi:hypothetical protein
LKNEIPKEGSENIEVKYEPYEIYQITNYSMLSNYEKKKIDCSFPTLKTLDYNYSLDNIKTFFGKNNVQKSKRITIHPKLVATIDENQLFNYLSEKSIFIGYPYKAFGRLEGIIYDRKYYYLYKGTMFTDKDFRFNNELVEIVNNSYDKQGISLNHPDLLCNVAKFTGFENKKGKMRRTYNEKAAKNPFYVPFEVTSLNSKSKDFDKFKFHFNFEYSNDVKDNKSHKIIKKNPIQNNNEEEKEEEINKLNVRPKFVVNSKFKKYPPEVRIETKKKMAIITQGPINVSEYRKNRIFKDENLEEHQIYYFKHPNSKSTVNNPYLIVK